MEKFYPVQIPYRGVVPLINKRGPLPRIELQKSMIEELKSMGVEMLNPDNGKPFEYPEEVKPAGGMEFTPAEEKAPEIVEPEKEPEVANPTTEISEESKVEIPAEETSETIVEPEKADDAEDDGEDEEVQIDPNSGAVMMDASKVPGYENLSRNKQKAVRRRFREVYAESKDLNIAYAEAAIAVNKKD